ncbi:hypothetical protein K443DRAFT_685349, partial [Laccaria amethystina LaAM-08-1]
MEFEFESTPRPLSPLPTLTYPANFYSETGHLAIHLYLYMCTFVGFFNIPM